MTWRDIHLGHHYRNLKRGTVYTILTITKDSELDDGNMQNYRVVYEHRDPAARGAVPWDRSMNLFMEKFEPATHLPDCLSRTPHGDADCTCGLDY